MVRTGILRAYGGNLRRRLGRSMSNRLTAFATGLGVTLLLQSSTATVLMAGSFASRGLVDTAAALAIMLGADVGTSLVAQIFSSRVGFLSPLLVLAGVIAFQMSKASRPRDLGRAVVGLGGHVNKWVDMNGAGVLDICPAGTCFGEAHNAPTHSCYC